MKPLLGTLDATPAPPAGACVRLRAHARLAVSAVAMEALIGQAP